MGAKINKFHGLLLRIRDYSKKKGMQFILSISFSIVALCGMVFMGIAINSRSVYSMKEMTISNNEQLIEQVNLNVNMYLRDMMRISNTMYYSVIKRADLGKESLSKETNLLYEANRDNLVSIACFKENGDLVSAAPIDTLKHNLRVSDQDWFIQANREIENLHFSTPHVQNLFYDISFNYHWVISLSRVVELTTHGRISRGILLVDMNFSGIEQLFTQVNFSNSGYVYLVDGDGEIIYHPKQSLINSGLMSENNKIAASYVDGTHEEKFEGEDRMVTVRTVGYTGWKIVSVTKTGEFFMSYYQTRLFYIIIIALTILLIFFANQFVSYLVGNPLKRLDDSVKDLEFGKLDSDIYIGGSYEIQNLGRTIKSMVQEMHRLMDEIVKEQENKRKIEFEALQSQINPHFLYNTLDSIVWMIESQQYDAAMNMVTSLANLFRISLSKGNNIIRIEEELKHAESYLYIQKLRYKNKFEVNFDIDPDIHDYCTIKLIVQPIIENAIYHGVGFMDCDGEITIKGYFKDDDIYIDIRDNGLGMPEDMVDKLLVSEKRKHKKGSGIGLSNVHQRIQLYFGREYGLEIDSELDEGTTVHIHLPKMLYDSRTIGEEGIHED